MGRRTTGFPIRLPIYISACIARAWVASGTLSGYRPPLPPHPLLGRIAYPALELSCDRRCSVAQISRPFDRQFLDLDEEMRTAIDAQATRDPYPGAAAAGEYGRRRRKCRLLAEKWYGKGRSIVDLVANEAYVSAVAQKLFGGDRDRPQWKLATRWSLTQ